MGENIQLRDYPKLEESMPPYLQLNFQDLENKVNDLEARVSALEAGP